MTKFHMEPACFAKTGRFRMEPYNGAFESVLFLNHEGEGSGLCFNLNLVFVSTFMSTAYEKALCARWRRMDCSNCRIIYAL